VVNLVAAVAHFSMILVQVADPPAIKVAIMLRMMSK
jgi:hypothetical protein